ncbi:DUF309 domain-containing protein, partial [Streptomyces sp. NEAU-H3]|nr:DUF309 domain-containing protein [Streptomyces sp. NEAU-H3]
GLEGCRGGYGLDLTGLVGWAQALADRLDAAVRDGDGVDPVAEAPRLRG